MCGHPLPRLHRPRGTALPAEPHEERVVSLCAELDAAQNAHGRVDVDVLAEVNDVQIFDGDPAKDRSRDRTRATSSIRTFQLILVSFSNLCNMFLPEVLYNSCTRADSVRTWLS